MDHKKFINVISSCTKEPLQTKDLKQVFYEKFRPILRTPEGNFLLMIRPDRGDIILGKGEIKTAMFAIDLGNIEIYVVTVSKKELCNPEKWKTLEKEIAFLKQVKGIPEFLQIKTALMSEEECYIITQYCNGGELFNELLSRKLSFLETIQLALDLSHGLQKLHALGLLHRDIKPHNIFLHKEPNGSTRAIIGDFDTVCKQTDLEALKELCGNPLWLSPEKSKIISSAMTPEEQIPFWQAASTPKDDIWSLGALFFTLFRGGALSWQIPSYPNEPTTSNIQKCANLTQETISKEIEQSHIPPCCIPLIKKMLQIDPTKRPTANEVYTELQKIRRLLN